MKRSRIGWIIAIALAVIILLIVWLSWKSTADEKRVYGSPYAVGYLDSLGLKEQEAIDRPEVVEVLVVLEDYYREDKALMEAIRAERGSNIPEIVSRKKEDKIKALHELMELYETCGDLSKERIFAFFFRYAEDTEDEEIIRFYEKLLRDERDAAAKEMSAVKSSFNPAQAGI